MLLLTSSRIAICIPGCSAGSIFLEIIVCGVEETSKKTKDRVAIAVIGFIKVLL